MIMSVHAHVEPRLAAAHCRSTEGSPTLLVQGEAAIDRPARLVRTAVAMLEPTRPFGWMVAAEATRRGFYEAGKKAIVGDGGNWIVAAPLMQNNPYDGHTLSETLAAVEDVTGVAVVDAYVDRG